MSNAALAWKNGDSEAWEFADSNIAGFSSFRQIPVRTLRGALSPRTSKAEPAWKGEVDRRLIELGQLGANWDDRGSAAVRSDVLEFVPTILHQVLRAGDKAPAVLPLGHGGVQLSWEGPGGELDVEVAAPMRVSVYYVDSHGQEHEWDTQADFARISAALAALG